MAENFTPAADIEKIYDDSLSVDLNYDKVITLINSTVTSAAKSSSKVATVQFKSFAAKYQQIVWPTLLSKDATDYDFNPYTHADAATAYTYNHRSTAEIGSAANLGACDENAPFTQNVLVPLAAAGYSWLFIFAQNEEYPCGLIISCDATYTFSDELADAALAYNEIVTTNQVIPTNFVISTSDGFDSVEASYFYRHINKLYSVLNSVAETKSAQGLTNAIVPWSSFSGTDLDIATFLYGSDYDVTANTEPLSTIDWTNAITDATYNSDYCVDFAVYRDTALQILFTDSWQSTMAATAVPATLLQLTTAISDYHFRPMWTSKNKIGGIYFSWVPQKHYLIDDAFKADALALINSNTYDSAYIVDIPDKPTYDTTKAKVNGQYLVSLLSQISAGLSTAMNNSEQTTIILWSAIDAPNAGAVRDFWNNAQAWSATIFKKDETEPLTGAESQSMGVATCNLLNAIVVRTDTTAYDNSWGADYLITILHYKDQDSCGFIIGYNSEKAYNTMKTTFEEYSAKSGT